MATIIRAGFIRPDGLRSPEIYRTKFEMRNSWLARVVIPQAFYSAAATHSPEAIDRKTILVKA